MAVRRDLRSSVAVSTGRVVSRPVRNFQAPSPSAPNPTLTPISVPFNHLVMYHGEIGLHRGRSYGFRDVFGFESLRDLHFIDLARKVKRAYTGRKVPSHKGWSAQREALRWFVENGREAIYNAGSKPIRVRRKSSGRYYIIDGHHRALALYILGEAELHALREG